MSVILNTNMKVFADRMNITSSRMVSDYGLKTVDEIIKAEAAQGNTKAIDYARQVYNSPAKLITLFNLNNVENKYIILHNMDNKTREMVLPLLQKDDLVMGLYFFTQDKLLDMLMKVDIEELVNVILGAFPLDQIVLMFKEEDLAEFFQQDKLEKYDVIKQLKILPPDVMQQFIEGITGRPYEETNPADLIHDIEKLPTDKYRDFMSSIDPMVQRQLVFQLTKDKTEYLQLFENRSYVEMLSTLMKPEMIKPMIFLEQESLIDMIKELPPDFMSIVAAQVDTQDFAEYLLDGHTDLLEGALLI